MAAKKPRRAKAKQIGVRLDAEMIVRLDAEVARQRRIRPGARIGYADIVRMSLAQFLAWEPPSTITQQSSI